MFQRWEAPPRRCPPKPNPVLVGLGLRWGRSPLPCLLGALTNRIHHANGMPDFWILSKSLLGRMLLMLTLKKLLRDQGGQQNKPSERTHSFAHSVNHTQYAACGFSSLTVEPLRAYMRRRNNLEALKAHVWFGGLPYFTSQAAQPSAGLEACKGRPYLSCSASGTPRS